MAVTHSSKSNKIIDLVTIPIDTNTEVAQIVTRRIYYGHFAK